MTEKPITIIRAPHNSENPYVATRRATAQDSGLSWEARGVLWFILSKPDDWEIRPETLELDLPGGAGCGRDKVMRILKELRNAGYLTFVQENLKGIFQPGYYRTHEVPHTANPVAVEPGTANPVAAQAKTPQPDEPESGSSGHIHIKDSIHNTESRNKEKKKAGASAPNLNPSTPGKSPKEKKPAAPKVRKDTPPSPPRKRLTELQKLQARLDAHTALAHAILPLVRQGYDPAMFTPKEYCGLSLLKDFVPPLEQLAAFGAQPGEMPELYTWIKKLPNYKQVAIGIISLEKQYQEWKAWKTRQQQKTAGAQRPPAAKSVPLVHKPKQPTEAEKAQAAANLESMRAARQHSV